MDFLSNPHEKRLISIDISLLLVVSKKSKIYAIGYQLEWYCIYKQLHCVSNLECREGHV